MKILYLGMKKILPTADKIEFPMYRFFQGIAPGRTSSANRFPMTRSFPSVAYSTLDLEMSSSAANLEESALL